VDAGRLVGGGELMAHGSVTAETTATPTQKASLVWLMLNDAAPRHTSPFVMLPLSQDTLPSPLPIGSLSQVLLHLLYQLVLQLVLQ